MSDPFSIRGKRDGKEGWLSLKKKSQIKTHDQRTKIFIKTLQYGSVAQPSTLKKWEKFLHIIRIGFDCPRCDHVMRSRLFIDDILCQVAHADISHTAHAVFCQM